MQIEKKADGLHITGIEDFLNLAINSGYRPEITFGGAENFNDYLWERLANGQDIEYLFDWAREAGI